MAASLKDELKAGTATVPTPPKESDQQQKQPPSQQVADADSPQPRFKRPRAPRDERPEASQKLLMGDYFEEEQLARELNVTRRTLRLWRLRHTVPPFGRLGKRIVYRVEAVRGWLASLDKPQRGRRTA